MNDLKIVGRLFISWRLLLFLPLIIGGFFPYRSGYQYTNIQNLLNSTSPLNNLLIFPWANFDGVHYLSIATWGYTTDQRFFPLFPLLIKLLTSLGGQSNVSANFLAGFFISNFFFLFALLVFYKLLRMDFSKEIAKYSLIFMLCFPASFFFGSIYSESLFLFLLLSSLFLARRGYFLYAAILGGLLSSTRLTGIFILPALILEYFEGNKKNWSRLLSLIIVPFGLIAFMVYSQKMWANPFYFISAQGELANGRSVSSIVLFPQTLLRYFKIFISTFPAFEWWIALLEVATFVLVTLLLVIGWKQKIRKSYLVFSTLGFLLPISSGTFSGLPRYILPLFPIYISLAQIRNSLLKKIILVIFSLLLLLLLFLFTRGYYIA